MGVVTSIQDGARRQARYRERMRCRRSIRFAAVLVAGVLALAASGCSAFDETPGSVARVFDAAVRALEATDGVTSVSSSIGPEEPMAGGIEDDPTSWVAHLSVETDSDVNDLGPLLDVAVQQAASVRYVALVDLTVSTRLGPASVSTLFVVSTFDGTPRSSSGAVLADAGVALASMAGAISVTVPATTAPAEVLVAEPASVPPVVASVRAVAAMGSGPLTAVTVRSAATPPNVASALSVTLDAVGPPDALVETLGGMVQRPGVDSVAYSAAGRNDSDTGTSGRPGVLVTVEPAASVNEVAGQLAGLDAGQSIVANSPRAVFSVRESTSSTSSTTSVTGFLGLPLGSSTPGDVAPDGSYRSAEADADRLSADSASVFQLLTEAGTIAGISGSPSVRIVDCGSGVGQQASGSTLIPIFEVADTADEAYAAIVDSWEATGLVYSEGAVGTAIYAATPPDLLVRHATIRGTVDGISIHAEGGC